MRRKRIDEDAGWRAPDPKRDGDPDRQFSRRAFRLTGLRLLRWQRWIAIMLLLIVAYLMSNPPDASKPAPAADLDPAGRVESWALTEQWLAKGALGADARIVSWNGQSHATVSDGSKDMTLSVNTLIVDSAAGWWRVRTTVTPDGRLSGWPSVERLDLAGADDKGDTGMWKDTLGQLTASDMLDTTVRKWADAFMGSDSDMLTVLVNDPDPNAWYRAQGLGKAAAATIDGGAYLDKGNVDRNERRSDRAALRVTVTVAHADAGDGSAAQSQYSYDLLVADPDGTPRILAWGAPGTGATLREHGNRAPGARPASGSGDTGAPSEASGGSDASGSGDGSR